MPVEEGVYGLLAEFNTPGDMVRATVAARSAGYRRMECYTPYPVEEAATALDVHRNRVLAAHADGRHHGPDHRVPHADVDVGDLVPRSMLQGVRSSRGLRSSFRPTNGRSCSRACPPHFPCWHSTACRSPITRSSTRRTFAWARQTISSSFAWRRQTRSFSLADSRSFLEGFRAASVVEVDL